jgi:hypothetical protein
LKTNNIYDKSIPVPNALMHNQCRPSTHMQQTTTSASPDVEPGSFMCTLQFPHCLLRCYLSSPRDKHRWMNIWKEYIQFHNLAWTIFCITTTDMQTLPKFWHGSTQERLFQPYPEFSIWYINWNLWRLQFNLHLVKSMSVEQVRPILCYIW